MTKDPKREELMSGEPESSGQAGVHKDDRAARSTRPSRLLTALPMDRRRLSAQ